tara:strand:- start:129 stop:536 length:408 start_codon:yes stop_codon:yes gene_type:complete
MKYYVPKSGKFELVASRGELDEATYKEVSLPLDDGDPHMRYLDVYEIVGGEAVPNMKKARDKCLSEIRSKRDAFLKELDSVQFRHVCSGNQDEVDKIEARKQELRDVPSTINWDSISNLYELNHLSPPTLGYVAI